MLDTYRENVNLLVAMPNALKAAVDQAGDAPEGEWSAAQVLAHLAATEQFWLERLNLMLHQRDALLKPPSADNRALEERLMAGDVDANLAAFNALRGETISLMMGLSLNDWTRTAVHETRGVQSIEDVVEYIIDHDSEHLEQIRALARQV